MQLEIVDIDDCSARLSVTGRLDTPGVNAIETRFAATATSAGKHVLVDLSEVSILTSMGIRMLISTARALQGRKRQMIIFGARDVVSETLEHVALNEVIPIVASEAQARELLN